ncbi:MAG: hypothetical protein ACD_49C00066G0012 [uncultured bacterium (gcode 4)]|uniref:Helix-turn-helix domain-containing protein n=1 Tax=uncultured bacterium (gcode 4) TaxID=1234023 RepID=K2BBG1_9BACT|nr:MAG: hypothetical protein ACD_49C00066G0012 [uncultured bacterium (gcode 4)]
MYSIDRTKWAKILDVSTRTLDRYIRSGKIRSQKKWKKVFLNDDDVNVLKNWWIQEDYEVIKSRVVEVNPFVKTDLVSYKNLYQEIVCKLEQKDNLIKDLSYKLGNAEAELKNSISLVEYKKTAFLLESSTNKIEQEKQILTETKEKLEKNLNSNKLVNLILSIFLFLTIILLFVVWFSSL